MVQFLSFVLVAVALFTRSTTADTNTTAPSAAFVADDFSIGFALNIPNDSDDLYFSILGPSSSSWLAVGLGSSKMANSLILMAYSASDGKNVTISPRLSYGHVEPSYSSNISISLLDGSGISNGSMTINARCSNCRSWKGGSIDPTNRNQSFLFAAGPDGSFKSNSVTASIKRHATYGTFMMDLTKAVGSAGVPASITNSTVGTTETSLKSEHDTSGAAHACIMIFAFVGLMPLGILILRVLNRPKWHAVNQTISAGFALLGVFLGIYIGTMYNRTKYFTSGHQIFGLIIIIAMIAQFGLGFMHHRIYKKTQSPTKLAPIHVWLGRAVIPAGIINGFLGFPLALNTHYNYALAGLLILVLIFMLPFVYWKRQRFMGSERHKATPETVLETSGYQNRPWAAGSTRSDIHLNNMQRQYPPAYEPRYA